MPFNVAVYGVHRRHQRIDVFQDISFPGFKYIALILKVCISLFHVVKRIEISHNNESCPLGLFYHDIKIHIKPV